ncbi:MAG: DNA repair protein RecO [Bacilli bacterium]|nr:DNA repair protein RecO [Bacilli bacterium]
MKIEKTEGIVLTETNYSESSKILNVLTKEYGLIGVISKGSRNLKSKLRGVSRKLVYGTFHIYYKEKGLSTLIGVDVINSFPTILSDLEKISYASFILELTNQVIKENDDEEIYELLKASLIKIEEGYNPLVITNILELKYLNYLGVSPEVDSCSICGSTKDIITISSLHGGYVCRDCYQNDDIIVSDKTIKMIRLFYYVDINKITKLDVSNEVSKEINTFLDDYYDRYTGIYLKSKNFIKELNKLNS